MKTLCNQIAGLSLLLAVLTIPARGVDAPAVSAPEVSAPETSASPPTLTPKEAKREAKKETRKAEKRKAKKEALTTVPAESPAPAAALAGASEPSATPAAASAPTTDSEGMLRLNFRGVPLEMVLDYMSEAAGFTIILETEVRGKVDVWNNQPLSKEEAVSLLNTVLNKNGYAALQNGRTLTIINRDEAKKRNIPVKSGNDPAGIPKSDEMVTQIIPIRFISAAQLTRDLTPLLPTQATMTANEAGNALVLTDTQVNIRRMAEIIKALDTSVSSAMGIRVFELRYADAKALVTTVKELFAQDTGRSSGSSGGFDPRSFFRPPGSDGPGGGDRGSSRTSSSTSTRSVAASKVVAVADERSNSLVVSAPDDLMVTIADLVKAVDTNVEDVTELRVFKLQYADPVEMAEVLSNLFPDESKSNENNRSSRFSSGFPFPFGGGGPPGSSSSSSSRTRSPGGSGSEESERAKKAGRVVAVPDARTASVIVSAARDLMKHIEQMVAQLDSNPARKQKVFVYSLENADAQEVEAILKSLFESQNNRNTRSSTSQNSPLTTRAQQSQSQTPGNNSGFGGNNSGFGGGNSGTPGGTGSFR